MIQSSFVLYLLVMIIMIFTKKIIKKKVLRDIVNLLEALLTILLIVSLGEKFPLFRIEEYSILFLFLFLTFTLHFFKSNNFLIDISNLITGVSSYALISRHSSSEFMVLNILIILFIINHLLIILKNSQLSINVGTFLKYSVILLVFFNGGIFFFYYFDGKMIGTSFFISFLFIVINIFTHYYNSLTFRKVNYSGLFLLILSYLLVSIVFTNFFIFNIILQLKSRYSISVIVFIPLVINAFYFLFEFITRENKLTKFTSLFFYFLLQAFSVSLLYPLMNKSFYSVFVVVETLCLFISLYIILYKKEIKLDNFNLLFVVLSNILIFIKLYSISGQYLYIYTFFGILPLILILKYNYFNRIPN